VGVLVAVSVVFSMVSVAAVDYERKMVMESVEEKPGQDWHVVMLNQQSGGTVIFPAVVRNLNCKPV
jgi:hypothetical protein